MTREETISVLENPDVSLGVMVRVGQEDDYWKKLRPALEMAISALRAQQEAEKNEPLTLDELREMDGEPVWVDCIDSKGYGCWMLVDVPNECLNNRVYCAVFEDYGESWLAYRRKLEEGT